MQAVGATGKRCYWSECPNELPYADTLKKCSRCKRALYCGVGCQKGDWPSHRVVCIPCAAPGNSLMDALFELVSQAQERAAKMRRREVTAVLKDLSQNPKWRPAVLEATTQKGEEFQNLLSAVTNQVVTQVKSIEDLRENLPKLLNSVIRGGKDRITEKAAKETLELAKEYEALFQALNEKIFGIEESLTFGELNGEKVYQFLQNLLNNCQQFEGRINSLVQKIGILQRGINEAVYKSSSSMDFRSFFSSPTTLL